MNTCVGLVTGYAINNGYLEEAEHFGMYQSELLGVESANVSTAGSTHLCLKIQLLPQVIFICGFIIFDF